MQRCGINISLEIHEKKVSEAWYSILYNKAELHFICSCQPSLIIRVHVNKVCDIRFYTNTTLQNK